MSPSHIPGGRLTVSAPEAAGAVVDQSAVAVQQVGHVLRLPRRGAGECQGLPPAGHPQLKHRRLGRGSGVPLLRPTSPVRRLHRLDALDLVETAQVRRLPTAGISQSATSSGVSQTVVKYRPLADNIADNKDTSVRPTNKRNPFIVHFLFCPAYAAEHLLGCSFSISS